MIISNKMRMLLIIMILTSPFFGGSDAQDLSGLIPGLQNLPAPDWVREGTRISYYSATADVNTANEKFILDEEGDWVGQTTGKRYRREELFGAAGHGVTQVDVLSIDDRVAALKVNSWLYSGFTGPLMPIKQAPAIGLAAGGDWYIHPEALASMTERRGGGVTIIRMPYTIGTVTYNAIRIQQESETATFARVYDLEDGKLLATFNAVSSAGGLSTVFAQGIFIGVRQMDLPWLGHDLPAWVKAGTVLRFEGTKTYEAIRAGTVMPSGVSLEMRIDDAAKRYYTYTQSGSMYVPGFPTQYGQDKLAGGIGEPGGLAMPPAALASLRAGQIIDEDPVTGIIARVVDLTRDDAGRETVVIGLENQVYSAELAYDLGTGSMVSFLETKLGAESNEYADLRLV